MPALDQIRALLYLCTFFFSLNSYGNSDSIVLVDFKKEQNTYSVFYNPAPKKKQNFDLISTDRKTLIKGEFEKDENSENGLFVFSNVKNWGVYHGSYIDGGDTVYVIVKFLNKRGLSIDGGDKIIAFAMTKGIRSFEIFLKNEAETIKLEQGLEARVKLNGRTNYYSGFIADLSELDIANGVHRNTITVKGKNLSAGQYLGEIYVKDQYENMIPVTVDISVKEKWHIPLLVLIMGLILGLLTNLYRVNKENYDLINIANGLLVLLKDLKSTNKIKDLINKVEAFKKIILFAKWTSKTDKTTELEGYIKEYKELSKNSESLNFLSDEIKTEIDLRFKSLKSFEYMGTIGTLLVIFSTIILGLIVFNKIYVQDIDFGANLLTDYLTLILGGAAASSTSSLVFGKKYREI